MIILLIFGLWGKLKFYFNISHKLNNKSNLLLTNSCLLSELLCGTPLFRGSKDIEQLELIFEKCGTPNESTWPGVTRMKFYDKLIPIMKKQYTWNLKNYYLDNNR